MLAKKAKSYWTGLQEPHLKDDNNELYKPDVIFVKEEGRSWIPTWVAKTFTPPPSLTLPIY